jgi:hypothetical protein
MTSYRTLSYLILSYLILSYLILSYLILSHLILSHLILSHPILSHLILSHLILSHLILSVSLTLFVRFAQFEISQFPFLYYNIRKLFFCFLPYYAAVNTLWQHTHTQVKNERYEGIFISWANIRLSLSLSTQHIISGKNQDLTIIKRIINKN